MHIRMDPERLISAFMVEFKDKEADGDNGGYHQVVRGTGDQYE